MNSCNIFVATIASIIVAGTSMEVCAGIGHTLYKLDGQVDSFTLVGSPMPTKKFSATAGWYFWKVSESQGKTKVRFTKHRNKEEENAKEHFVRKDVPYIIDSSVINDPLVSVYMQGFSLGVLAVPIKFRLKSAHAASTLSQSASIGPYIGYKYLVADDFYLTGLMFAGPTILALNDSTANGVENALGYSIGGGVVLEAKSEFQFGFVFGKDKISGEKAENGSWPFQNKYWISFAIGFRFIQ